MRGLEKERWGGRGIKRIGAFTLMCLLRLCSLHRGLPLSVDAAVTRRSRSLLCSSNETQVTAVVLAAVIPGRNVSINAM